MSSQRMARLHKQLRNASRSVLVQFGVGLLIGNLMGQVTIICPPHASISENFQPSQPTVYTRKRKESSGDDLEERNSKVYIGILSAKKYVDTRALASLSTWGRKGETLVEVFADVRDPNDSPHEQVTTTLKTGHHVISLPNIKDNVYPPQKKSFAAVKYMYDHHLNDFNWFIRLDDDAYVKTDKLLKFLNRVNSSHPWYIGNPAFGDKGDRVPWSQFYCMGGPGMIMSRELLRRVGPHLGECLTKLETEHEDVELGRCITRHSGAVCTHADDTTALFHQHIEHDRNPKEIKIISEAELDAGLTFHCNKYEQAQINFHYRVLKNEIKSLLNRLVYLHSKMKNDNEVSAEEASRDENQFVSFKNENSFRAKPQNPSYFTLPIYIASFPEVKYLILRKAKELAGEKSILVCEEVRGYHTAVATSTFHVKAFVKCRDRAKRSGSSFKVDLSTKQAVVEKAVFWRETMTLSGAIDEYRKKQECEKRSFISSCEDKTTGVVNFLLSLYGRVNTFNRFIGSFENAFLARGERANLIVTYFSSQENYLEEIRSKFSSLGKNYPKSKFEVVEMPKSVEFSRGRGLHESSKRVKSDEILFFCDVDLVFTPELLAHIRRSTIRGKQVFYPVFFSEFDPEIAARDTKPEDGFEHIRERNGFWRDFSFGMVAMYRSDYIRTGGFDLRIKGWGLEDEKLGDRLMKLNVALFRSNEPGLVHVFHHKSCSPKWTPVQYGSCRRSRAEHFASKHTLHRLWEQKKRKRRIH